MRTSDQGRAFIEAFEGLFLKTYDDGEGVLTIGYGHTTEAGPPTVTKGMVITKERADQILAADLAKVKERVARIIGQPLNQSELDALVSFEFNTGDLAKSSIPSKIRAGHDDEAMATLLQYVHGANSGKVYAGLARRRKAEKMLFEGDVAGALKLADAHVIAQDSTPKAKPPAPEPEPQPAPTKATSLIDFILSIIRAIFGRK